MPMCVCLNVCACVYGCESVNVRVGLWVHVSVYMCACVCVCMPVCVCLNICACVYGCESVNVCVSVSVSACVCERVWLCLCVFFPCVCVCAPVPVSVYRGRAARSGARPRRLPPPDGAGVARVTAAIVPPNGAPNRPRDRRADTLIETRVSARRCCTGARREGYDVCINKGWRLYKEAYVKRQG